MTAQTTQVVLTWPTALGVPTAASATGPRRTSWIQIVRTGTFVSDRYGRFSITTDDLRTMLRNFTTVTPKAPTRLPVDYDHLSLDPKRPGDGIAAGWIADLALRNDHTELWARVEWTAEAAKRIAAKEYQFISPTFVKNHTAKDGTTIGATLLAAAVTNHPFLEGMQAITLLSDSLQYMAVPANVDGASAVPTMATPVERIERRARQLIEDSRGQVSLANAIKVASAQLRDASAGYLEEFGSVRGPVANTITPMALHQQPGEGFVELVTRVAREHRIDLRAACHVVAEAYPGLAAAYSRAADL